MRILSLILLSSCALAHEPADANVVSGPSSGSGSELFHCEGTFDGHAVQYNAQLQYADGSVVVVVAGVDGVYAQRVFYPDQVGYDRAPVMVRVLHGWWTVAVNRYALTTMDVSVSDNHWTTDHCTHFWR